jgi:KUP system potassium uptake protein
MVDYGGSFNCLKAKDFPLELEGIIVKKRLPSNGHLWESSKAIIKSLGLVFGDIGTSPIYTMPAIFMVIPITPANVIGVVSLILWTLTLLVSVQYTWLAMSLSQKGEGGTIVLREILVPLLRSPFMIKLATLLSFVGISFLIGDGVITPAISILSAVEGIRYIPAFSAVQQWPLIMVASIICFFLFYFQKRGTERVSSAFGPIMLLWFLAIGFFGLIWIVQAPLILHAINPLQAINFLIANKGIGFFVLSVVILAVTGCEALYADMGHLGRIPIIRAWITAFVMLTLSYLGQGAFLLIHAHYDKIVHAMVSASAPSVYILFFLLSIMATVIASQAMISGIFSIVYQGITTNILPKLKIEYTSRFLRSQIFIPAINWFLFVFVLLAILQFKYSENLAHAYGFAVTLSMNITSFFITSIFFLKKQYVKAAVAVCTQCINFVFLLSGTLKLPAGGYWSVLIALIPLSFILIYTLGKRRLARILQPESLNNFLEDYLTAVKRVTPIQGTGLFLSRSTRRIPVFITHTMFSNNIIYEENIILSVVTLDKPFGISVVCKNMSVTGLCLIEVHMGYMEVLDLEYVLTEAGISPTAIFYGLEEIEASAILWKIFALIKNLTPSFVQFYKLPAHKLHGVVMRISM